MAVFKMPAQIPKTSLPMMMVEMVLIRDKATEKALNMLKIKIVFLLPMGIIIPPRVHPRASPNWAEKLMIEFQS